MKRCTLPHISRSNRNNNNFGRMFHNSCVSSDRSYMSNANSSYINNSNSFLSNPENRDILAHVRNAVSSAPRIFSNANVPVSLFHRMLTLGTSNEDGMCELFGIASIQIVTNC